MPLGHPVLGPIQDTSVARSLLQARVCPEPGHAAYTLLETQSLYVYAINLACPECCSVCGQLTDHLVHVLVYIRKHQCILLFQFKTVSHISLSSGRIQLPFLDVQNMLSGTGCSTLTFRFQAGNAHEFPDAA